MKIDSSFVGTPLKDYTTHLLFHRPVRPGDMLIIKGRIAAIMPHRAGTVVVVRFDAIDHEGKSVFTEHIDGMMRGVECVGKSRGEEDLPLLPPVSANVSAQ